MRTRVNKIKDLAKALKSDETGSLTIFSLFIFILILFMAGMAVDLMRYEHERTGLQNAMDSGVIAASSLSQGVDFDAEDTERLVKDYVAKAGYDPDLVTVTPTIISPDGSSVTSRTVRAEANFKMDTIFMHMMGIDDLDGVASGTALEGSEILEIAMVLDISGSMANGDKMQNLKDAAKEFVTTVLSNNDPSRVSISIVPYNQQVYMDAELRARLNLTTNPIEVPGPISHPGAITTYSQFDLSSPCAAFDTSDFQSRSLVAAGTTIDTSAQFVDDMFYWALDGNANQRYQDPYEFSYWCGNFHPKILLYQNNETVLHNYIDTLRGYGATAIDIGMNWGVGILDPSFTPVVNGMVDDNLLIEGMRGRPVNYGANGARKYVILMTDGKNTQHLDLKDEYKSGPTRIWHSETQADGDAYDGYLVEMPDNAPDERWYVPGDPFDTSDDLYLTELPSDAIQWDFQKLYREFRTNDAARYFFGNSDSAAKTEFLDVVVDTGGFTDADVNLDHVCDAAKANDRMNVFTVAFEAPEEGQTVLENCASGEGNYFPVTGEQLTAAFNAIAVQISLLRLTE
ncbi:MAG: hypothetical protein HKN27_09405 [Silicimonas sp.]|nr:hypothetical protein [Silicimonas sp.]